MRLVPGWLRRRRRPSRVLVASGVVLVLLVAGLVGAVAADRAGRITLPVLGRDYCEVVQDGQDTLTRAIGSGEPTALISVLPVLAALERTAPSDVADEWQQVVSRVRALDEALTEAGVDPATYDAAKPPAGVDQQQRAAIAAAALELLRPETLQSFQTVSQEVRDVCHTPLYQ